MTRPRLLDLFCGAGGAAMGYHQAGFDVVGVDINPQPRYPFEFHQADALEFPLEGFDAIHASPPCQAYTDLKVMHNAREHPDLIPPTRAHLLSCGVPWAMENVPGAKRVMRNYVVLCGTTFGLGVASYDRELRRHRLFETSFPMMVPRCYHQKATIGIYGDHARDHRRTIGERGRDFPDAEKIELAREALGMPWAQTWQELTQAIPPAYTRFIGEQLRAHLEAAA